MFESWILNHRQQIISSLQNLLQIPSVGTEADGPDRPFGMETDRALKFMLKLGADYGFAVRNQDGYAGHIEMGDSGDYVAVLAHLDVVPPGNGWTYPPFGAEIHDNKIYARGAIDDKGPAMAAFYGLLAVKASGLPLSKKVRVILGIDEETDWRCMDHYFKKEPIPWGGFTPDADFPLIYAEKGILQVTLARPRKQPQGMELRVVEIVGGERPNMVPDRCAATCTVISGQIEEIRGQVAAICTQLGIGYRFTPISPNQFSLSVEGQSAHGSLPELGINAIQKMGEVLRRLPFEESDLWTFLASADTNGRFLGIECSDAVSGPLTCNLGMVEIDGTSAKFTFDVRYPIDQTGEDLLQLVQQSTAQYKFHVEQSNNRKPLYVPKDFPVVTTLRRVYEEIVGQPATLLTIGGGTYARAIPNAVAFGPLFPGMADLAHQKDECIEIGHLIQLTNIYANAIYQLAK